MTSYATTPVEWPLNADARQALEAYLDLAAKQPGERPALAADSLDFRGADLSYLDLFDAYFLNTCLSGVRVVRANLAGTTLSGSDLRHANLSGADLTKVEAVECDASDAAFRAATAFAADFNGADLSRADFRDAYLNSAWFLRSNLEGSDLRGASIRFARFGDKEAPTRITGARAFGSFWDGASGVIAGRVDVGESDPQLIGGDELATWIRQHGGTDITVAAG